jgi:hypothetical protein
MKQLFFSRQNLVDIRNVYAVMTDILHKNIAKAGHCIIIFVFSAYVVCRSEHRRETMALDSTDPYVWRAAAIHLSYHTDNYTKYLVVDMSFVVLTPS